MKKKNLLMTAIAIFGLATITIAQVPSYVPTNGLKGWWPFSGNANDASVNMNNGTVNGTTLTTDRFGNSNSAYSFNGSTNYINIANSAIAAFGLQSFSTSVWFKSTSGGTFVRYDNCVTGSGWGVGNSSMDLFGLEFPASRVPNNVIEPNAHNDNSWHLAVFVRNIVLMKDIIYVDGILKAQTSFSTINDLQNTGSVLRFGSCSGYLYFSGFLDDIGIWNRTLTVCEIKDLYNAQLNSSTSIQAGTDVSICEGNDVIFNGSGGSNYTWNNGVQNGVAYTPTISQEYIVIGQDANNCYGTDTIYVELMPNTTATQTETALDSYTWPINSQTYTQSGTYTAVIPNAAGCDSTITLDLSLDFTGINEFSEDNLFTVFPNPAQSAINIKADNKLIGDVYTIYDNTGRVVLTGKLNSKDTTIELYNLSEGIYMFSVGENMKQTFKLIKE